METCALKIDEIVKEQTEYLERPKDPGTLT